MFAQRATWFRLLPMRATCRVRSRSTSAAAAVQVRVRAIACRSRSDSGTPTAADLARQAARSAGDTRAWISTVRRSAISAPRGRSGGNGPRSPVKPEGARDAGGSKGGVASPSPDPNVDTRGRLAMRYKRQGPAGSATRARPSISDSRLRRADGSALVCSRGSRLRRSTRTEVGSVSSVRVARLSWAR